jgi:hypothetical protein
LAQPAERTAEEDLSRRLGPEFRMRPDGIAREIVGIDEAVRDLFSSRRRAISAGTAELAASYEERHGHAPSAYVLRLMAEHVTLKTRARNPSRVQAATNSSTAGTRRCAASSAGHSTR